MAKKWKKLVAQQRLRRLIRSERMSLMRQYGITLKVEIDKGKVLESLRTQREEHVAILSEANEGYRRAAIRLLTEQLDAVSELGKRAWVNLTEPQSWSKVFDAAIATIEAHDGDRIALNADEHRLFIEGDWPWRAGFLISCAEYAPLAKAAMVKEGISKDGGW